jgi:hypothetical protein
MADIYSIGNILKVVKRWRSINCYMTAMLYLYIIPHPVEYKLCFAGWQ